MHILVVPSPRHIQSIGGGSLDACGCFTVRGKTVLVSVARLLEKQEPLTARESEYLHYSL